MANEAKIIAELEPVPAEVTALVGEAIIRAGTNEEGRLVLEVNEDFPFTDDKPEHLEAICALMAARFPQRISNTKDVGGLCVPVTVKLPNGTFVTFLDCRAQPAEQ